MKKKLSCSTIVLLYALVIVLKVVRKASAQCTANGCTICNETVLVCEGLNTVPQLEDMDVSNIKRISLTNGTISEIPRGYFNLSNLDSINLSSNQLPTFNMESLQYATSLTTIDLTNNPIECNNNIDWLQKWKTFRPGNKVTGTCTVSGEDINTYLSDKPTNLVGIKFAEPTLVLDRSCSEVTLPFVVTGDFAIDLEYRASIEIPPRSAEVSVVYEYITVPAGANSSEVMIAVSNRGENREDVETRVKVITKYPVSYGAQVVVRLLNGLNGVCQAPVPVVVPTTKPSVKPTQDDTKTIPPKVSTRPAPTFEPEPASESKPKPPQGGFPVGLVIIIIIAVLVIAVISVAVLYICFRRNEGTV